MGSLQVYPVVGMQRKPSQIRMEAELYQKKWIKREPVCELVKAPEASRL